MAEEFIDVLDENGKKTGVRKTRTEVHAKGLWHGAVHVWIYNSKGEILLQRRSMQKDSWPGRWDISVAGHISAGETPERAALKEVSEEIGVKLSAKDLKQVMIRKSSSLPKAGFFNNEFDYVYLCEMDKLPENLQKEEVEAVEFVPLSRLEEESKDPLTAKRFVPHTYLPELIEIIKIIRSGRGK